MKHKYIKIISCLALISILSLQGLWLYTTYCLLEDEINKELVKVLTKSVEKECFIRLEDPRRKDTWQNKVVKGFMPDNDIYKNIIALQNFLFLENYPISLCKLDSIISNSLTENQIHIDYSLLLIDSTGMQKALISHLFRKSDFTHKIQLRTIEPEQLIVTISSPYKIILGKMLLLLIGSLLLAIIVIYCMVLQIKIIIRQNRIAEIRQDFTHAMIHDLKNPITSILMGVSALKSGKIDHKPEMKDQYFNIITKEGRHMLALTNKILTLAQFEENKISLSKELINLNELICNLTEKYEINALKNVAFLINLGSVDFIYADYEYIYELFNNILDNSIKYSKESVLINISAAIKKNFVEISIKDDGIGISLKDQKKIFDKFERAAIVRKGIKTKGFGLGLNYVYQVITAHNGKVKINSKVGTYTEFIISLPNND